MYQDIYKNRDKKARFIHPRVVPIGRRVVTNGTKKFHLMDGAGFEYKKARTRVQSGIGLYINQRADHQISYQGGPHHSTSQQKVSFFTNLPKSEHRPKTSTIQSIRKFQG